MHTDTTAGAACTDNEDSNIEAWTELFNREGCVNLVRKICSRPTEDQHFWSDGLSNPALDCELLSCPGRTQNLDLSLGPLRLLPCPPTTPYTHSHRHTGQYSCLLTSHKDKCMP